MRSPNLKNPSSNDCNKEKPMIAQTNLAGSFTLPGTSLAVNRMGYGAMQLSGRDGDKLVWGPPKDVDEAIAVLREAVASGVNHIDTSDYYGPHVTNQIIRKALSPYPKDLVIVTKLGARRTEDGAWLPAFSRRSDRRGSRQPSQSGSGCARCCQSAQHV